jgi:hypothetical protein
MHRLFSIKILLDYPVNCVVRDGKERGSEGRCCLGNCRFKGLGKAR